ncbi:MAG: DUF4338 domain-containing protein [Colwellia sp.]|nr:DUF4338 domain-containing protein [Colwellia sp.]
MVELEYCKRTDPRYQEIRDRHYVENRGCHGQQIHFMVWFKGVIVGIISGASSVYAVKPRDEYFNIPKDKHLKQKRYLPSIVNNVVFRLEVHHKNLATMVLKRFRKVVADLWEELYNTPVIGFETFVVEEDYRKGTLYKADNWEYLGETKGSTKSHKGLKSKSERVATSRKMIYAIKTKRKVPETDYVSSWRSETLEDKTRQKRIAKLKKDLVGKRF